MGKELAWKYMQLKKVVIEEMRIKEKRGYQNREKKKYNSSHLIEQKHISPNKSNNKTTEIIKKTKTFQLKRSTERMLI
jgi:hypothetical protein